MESSITLNIFFVLKPTLNILVPYKFWVQKIVGPQQFYVWRILWPKIVSPTNFVFPKNNVGPKIFVLKNFGSNKSLCLKDCGS